MISNLIGFECYEENIAVKALQYLQNSCGWRGDTFVHIGLVKAKDAGKSVVKEVYVFDSKLEMDVFWSRNRFGTAYAAIYPEQDYYILVQGGFYKNYRIRIAGSLIEIIHSADVQIDVFPCNSGVKILEEAFNEITEMLKKKAV